MLIVCPSCDSKVLVPDGAMGQKGKCPKCGFVFTIPASQTVPQPPRDAGITTNPIPTDLGVPRPMPRRPPPDEEDIPPPRRPRRDDFGDEDDDDDDDGPRWDPRSLRRTSNGDEIG